MRFPVGEKSILPQFHTLPEGELYTRREQREAKCGDVSVWGDACWVVKNSVHDMCIHLELPVAASIKIANICIVFC